MREDTHVRYFLTKYFAEYCVARRISGDRFGFTAARVGGAMIMDIIDHQRGDYQRIQIPVSSASTMARVLYYELERWYNTIVEPNGSLLKIMKSFIRKKYGI